LERGERDDRRDRDDAGETAEPVGITEKLVWIDAITQRPAMR